MTGWEKIIADAFTCRRPASSVAGRNTMRLRALSVFPGFEAAGPDEKESFLEAAESLERQGLLQLNWEKRGKGERLKTITCLSIEKIFALSGGKDPRLAAEEIRAMIKTKITAPDTTNHVSIFLGYLAEHFDAPDAARGMDLHGAEDFVRLLERCFGPGAGTAEPVNMTTRALSVRLYRDSKRLEQLLNLARPLLHNARKRGIPAPDFSFLERSFPETMIGGKLVFEYADKGPDSTPPLVNAEGNILGFPLASAAKLRRIKTARHKERPSVLTVENKETFYALAQNPAYDCCLYAGGYVNQAAAVMIRLLAGSGFCFYHAGDLDPDGVLILQHIMDIAQKPVAPVKMDAAVFDRYLPWSRPLKAAALRQAAKIRAETRALPGLAELLCRITETGRGVEQEIIDYGHI